MKKLISLTLALCLLFSLTTIVFAEAAEAEFQIDVESEYAGIWFNDENTNLTYYVPEDWNILEITEEQTEAGFVTILADPDQTMIFSLGFDFKEKGYSVADIAKDLTESEMNNIITIKINGFDTVGYSVDESSFGLAQIYEDADQGLNVAYCVISAADEATVEKAQAILVTIVASMDVTE